MIDMSLLSLLFTFHLSSAGINIGTFYSISTLLNRMIIGYYPVSSALAACV